MVTLFLHAHQTETTYKLDFMWKEEAIYERGQTDKVKLSNQKLLENILPLHVADHFLRNIDKNTDVSTVKSIPNYYCDTVIHLSYCIAISHISFYVELHFLPIPFNGF